MVDEPDAAMFDEQINSTACRFGQHDRLARDLRAPRATCSRITVVVRCRKNMRSPQ